MPVQITRWRTDPYDGMEYSTKEAAADAETGKHRVLYALTRLGYTLATAETMYAQRHLIIQAFKDHNVL